MAQDISIYGIDDLWMLEWKGKHTALLDTQFVRYTDSIIAFYDYSPFFDSLSLESQYSFPFQKEDKWSLANDQGTYSVHSDSIPSSHFGLDFGFGYYLKRMAIGDDNFSIHDNTVLVKNIGIVYRVINVTIGVPRRRNSYFLIDYHIE